MQRDPRTVVVTAEVGDMITVAARITGLTESQVVCRALRELARDPAADRPDPWTPIEVTGTYGGETVTGQYIPGSKRVTVTSGAVAGQSFRSPSGAASAVVAALNPNRTASQTNGWRFWHVAATGERLEVYRR